MLTDGARELDRPASRTDTEKCATTSSMKFISRSSKSARMSRSWSLKLRREVDGSPPLPCDRTTVDVVDGGEGGGSLALADMINNVAPAPTAAPTPNRATLAARDRVLIISDDGSITLVHCFYGKAKHKLQHAHSSSKIHQLFNDQC